MFWVILSTLFIVAFPTLAGSMTGYAPVTDGFLQDQDGKLIPYIQSRPIRYIVHDSDRLGLDKPLILSDIPEESNCKSITSVTPS
jgi:hypothetical protein